MANHKQVTEPAATPKATAPVTEPAKAPSRKRDPRNLVYVYAVETGRKLDRPVPETWLDRFPQLREVSSKKAGK